MIKIQEQPCPDNLTLVPDAHYLVVAEDGFSMLTKYGEKAGLDRKTIRAFADTVNYRDACGSLHPKAPISAIPRRYLRNCGDSPDEATVNAFKIELRNFLKANTEAIKASKIIIDLHVSPKPLPEVYLSAIESIFDGNEHSGSYVIAARE
jgi:hypothetical protein